MHFGVSIFHTDYLIPAVGLVPALEARGFESMWTRLLCWPRRRGDQDTQARHRCVPRRTVRPDPESKAGRLDDRRMGFLNGLWPGHPQREIDKFASISTRTTSFTSPSTMAAWSAS